MWRNIVLLAGVVIAVCTRLAAQEEWSAAPLGTPPLRSAKSADQRAPKRGAPANRWRYRFSNGRWWYLTPDSRWSYYDGRRWRPYSAGSSVRRPVDPALLRLEYKEGSLGRRRWPRVGGGTVWQGGGAGALPLSGTQGSAGGTPSGSFTSLGGVDTGINTSSGTTTGVGGLSGAGRAVSGGGLSPTMGGGKPR